MFKSEKTLSVPGDYQIVFESCVLALKDARVRVKSANAQTGIISGRTSQDRVDVLVQQGAGECVVTATSEFSGVYFTDLGRNARRVNRFFDVLLARVAPLAGNAQALAAVQASTPSGSLPSARYSSTPMRKRVGETSFGKAIGWVFLVLGLLFFLGLILSLLAANH